MSLKLVFVLILAALPAAAQAPWREPKLILDLNDPGRLQAWLTLSVPMPQTVSRAFAQAMGCPPDAVTLPSSLSTSAHADCAAPPRTFGLRWSAHWDLGALSAELSRIGAQSLDIDIHHPRAGFSTVRPAAICAQERTGFSVTHHGDIALAGLRNITLESGFDALQLWLLAAAAGAVLLLPLLLFPARTAGPLPAMAAGNGLFCLAASAWLCATLPLNIGAIVPFPWNLAVMSAPLLAAVWIGSRIIGGPRRRIFVWRGIRAVAFITMVAGFFAIGPNMIPWIVSGGAAIAFCFWRLHRAGGHSLQPLAEGELLVRIRQLAARAGTRVKSVQLLISAEDLPAAFATRLGGILLSGGLLGALSRREVDAIVSHELSHLRRPRTVSVRGLVLLLPVAIFLSFFVPSSLQWMPLLLMPVYLTDRFMRRRMERRADADAVVWCGDAEPLITGLVRVTQAHSIPLEWPAWVKPLLPHPSTMARVRAAAAQARIPEERLAQLIASAAVAPADFYPIEGAAGPAGSVYTPAQRARLGARLALVGAAFPIAFGVAAPFIGYLAALLGGAASAILVSEWVLWRARSRARALLPGRAGVFSGFSPSAAPRVYDGSYDYDWGFGAFEGDRLVFRGDRCTWSVTRHEVAKISLVRGPAAWLPRPAVCFQLDSGVAFTIRPFDGAFALAARRAAARLAEQAVRWHTSAAPPDSAAVPPAAFDFASVPGQAPPQYTMRTLLRAMPRFSAISLAVYWSLRALSPSAGWVDPFGILEPVAVTCALLLFSAWPSLRSSRNSMPPRVAPVATGGAGS